MHILVAIDGSDLSGRALQMGARMATGAGVDLSVVHFAAAETNATDAVMQHAQTVLDTAGLDVSPRVSSDLDHDVRPVDRIGEAVLQYVEAAGIDHVLMGHHGAGAVEQAVLGSTTETVIEAQHVPVTVVP